MKKFLKFLVSRLVITALLVLLQAVFLFLSISYVESVFGIALLNSTLSIIMCITIFYRDDAQEYKLSWILLLVIVPILGTGMYLLFGNKKNSRVYRRRMELYSNQYSLHSVDDYTNKAVDVQESLPERDAKLAEFLGTYSDSRVFGNTTSRYYRLGDDSFQDILADLRKARTSIFMEYFIYQSGVFWDSILEILKAKAAEGLDVRVLYDDMGCINTLPSGYYKELRSYGIKAVAFNPVRPRLNPNLNYRDHRKVCIIDGNVAYSGGINIADEYINRTVRFGHWKDNCFRLEGSGVWNYTYMFLQLWTFSAPEEFKDKDFSVFAPTCDIVGSPSDGYVQSFGDTPLDKVNVAESAYMHVLNSAHDYVWISTPYLILDSSMVNTLVLAARSGVDVRIITPSIPDKKIVYAVTKDNYGKLLENGVRIFEYKPGFIHSKMFLSDDRISIVGTTNMDFRSFFLHFESGTVFYGSKMLSSVKEDFVGIFGQCDEVTLESYRKRSFLMKLTGVLARIAAPLL